MTAKNTLTSNTPRWLPLLDPPRTDSQTQDEGIQHLDQEILVQKIVDQQLYDSLSSSLFGASVTQLLFDDSSLVCDEDNNQDTADEGAIGIEFAISSENTVSNNETQTLLIHHSIPPITRGPSNMISQLDFLMTQVADQARIPWEWSNSQKKNNAPYYPTVKDKWWYEWAETRRRTVMWDTTISHVGRIMETELGVQLFGSERCTVCQENRTECWAYSDLGRSQIRFSGSACARCRAGLFRTCTVAKRHLPKKGVEEPLPQPKIRILLPKPSTNWRNNC